MDDMLIIKFLSGKADSGESERVIDWLNQKHDNRVYYFNLKRIWQESAVNSKSEDFINKSWERLKARMDATANEISMIGKNADTSWNLRRIAVAACIAILFATSSFFGIQNYKLTGRNENINRIIVPLGSRSRVILPDGSNVWLNSGSTLIYNTNYAGKEREVSLEGEGFFDVKHISSNSPFIVSAGGINIKVLGTTFNVKCYPDEKIVETTLVKGKIEINTDEKSNLESPLILSPNQKLTYIKEDNTIKLSDIHKDLQKELDNISVPRLEGKENFQITTKINPEIYTSWKEGKLIFNGETLENLLPKLERFYNVKITLEDESMKSFRYTGTLEEVTIEEVLRAIESTSPIRFEINKNKIVLRMRKTNKHIN